MAVARAQTQGGISGIHIWLIAFVAMWLTSTVLLVILYLDHDKKEAEVATVRADYDKAVSRAAQRLPQFAAAKPRQGETMADLLERDRRQAAEVAVGDPDADADALQSQLQSMIESIQADARVKDPSVFAGASFKSALATLLDLFRAESDAHGEAQDGLDRIQREMEALREDYAKVHKDFDEQSTDLKSQVAKIASSSDDYRRDRDAEIDAFEEQIGKIRQECSDDIQNQRRLNQELAQKYEDLMTRYQELKQKLGKAQVSPIELATARTGDGMVLDAKPDDNVVYINLGGNDHVTMGLEFAVYDALRGIPPDGKAKARIEVVKVFDQTSECRVTTIFGNATVSVGDLIANPVYDKERPLRFYILGEFDLDGDLRPDRDGAQRIEALVRKWGGLLDERLTGEVDFVILGGPPARPRPPSEFEPTNDEKYQEAQRRYEAYSAQLATIQGLAIPTLTQSVFLNFLGYSGSTAPLIQAGVAP